MKAVFFLILTLTLVTLPDLTSAATLVPCSGTECSACNFAQMGNSVFKWLIGVLFVVFGFVAAMGGFGLVTSGGNPEAKSAAKQKLINAVIGILIMFAAWLLVDTILRGLVTGGEGKINGTYWYSIECGSQTKTNGAKVTAAKHNLTTFTAPEVTTAATTINSTPVNQSIVNAAAKAGMTEPTDLNTFLALMYVESDSCTKTVSTEADVYGCGQISVDTARSMDPSLTEQDR
jgi:hypothetical protein